MLDIKSLARELDRYTEQLARRGVEREEIRHLAELYERRLELIPLRDELRATVNRLSKETGRAIGTGAAEEVVNALRAESVRAKQEMQLLADETDKLESELAYCLLRVPNLPSVDAPPGLTSEDNTVVRFEGYYPERYTGKQFRPHWELGEMHHILDLERSAKLAGSMFSMFRGPGAKLIRALVQLALNLNTGKYEEILPPYFARTEIMTGTGHLPKFEEDMYRCRDDDLWAIPTAEVPLTSLYRDEILSRDELPKRFMAYTACYRREAGSAGRDTRGLLRLHEFHKVELLSYVHPDDAQAEFTSLLADAEKPLKLLDLPYRVVDLCDGDLGFSAARTFDLEVYAPGVDRWLEVSSVTHFTDFQARRANVRFRDDNGRPTFVHTINGSGIATPRVWAAIVEHGQREDGSIVIPEVLQDFMGMDVINAVL